MSLRNGSALRIKGEVCSIRLKEGHVALDGAARRPKIALAGGKTTPSDYQEVPLTTPAGRTKAVPMLDA